MPPGAIRLDLEVFLITDKMGDKIQASSEMIDILRFWS